MERSRAVLPLHLKPTTQKTDAFAKQRESESPEDRKIREMHFKLNALKIAYPEEKGKKTDAGKRIRKLAKKIRLAEEKKNKQVAAPKIQSIVRRFLKEKRLTSLKEIEVKKTAERKEKETKALVETVPIKTEKKKVDEAVKAAKKARAKARKAAKKAEEKAKKIAHQKILISADPANKKNICDILYSQCESDAERAFITLIYKSSMPIHLLTSPLFTSHVLILIKNIESGTYKKSILKDTLEKDDGITKSFFDRVHQQINEQLEILFEKNKRVEIFINPKVIKCASPEYIATIARTMLVKAGDCGFICGKKNFVVKLPQIKGNIVSHLHSWIVEIHKAIAVYKMRIQHLRDTIPSTNEHMSPSTFDIYMDTSNLELFSTFSRLFAGFSSIEDAEAFFRLEKEFLLQDLKNEDTFAWIPQYLAKQVLETNIDSMVTMWRDIYEKVPSTELGKQVIEIINEKLPPYYYQMFDRSMSDITNPIYLLKAKKNLDEAHAVGCISNLDRFTLLHYAITCMKADVTITSETNEEQIISYLLNKIESCTSKDVIETKIIEAQKKIEVHEHVKTYIENIEIIGNIFNDVYKKTIVPINKGITYISRAALEVFNLSLEMKDAGL